MRQLRCLAPVTAGRWASFVTRQAAPCGAALVAMPGKHLAPRRRHEHATGLGRHGVLPSPRAAALAVRPVAHLPGAAVEATAQLRRRRVRALRLKPPNSVLNRTPTSGPVAVCYVVSYHRHVSLSSGSGLSRIADDVLAMRPRRNPGLLGGKQRLGPLPHRSLRPHLWVRTGRRQALTAGRPVRGRARSAHPASRRDPGRRAWPAPRRR